MLDPADIPQRRRRWVIAIIVIGMALMVAGGIGTVVAVESSTWGAVANWLALGGMCLGLGGLLAPAALPPRKARR